MTSSKKPIYRQFHKLSFWERLRCLFRWKYQVWYYWKEDIAENGQVTIHTCRTRARLPDIIPIKMESDMNGKN